jgi:hypothetical protein
MATYENAGCGIASMGHAISLTNLLEASGPSRTSYTVRGITKYTPLGSRSPHMCRKDNSAAPRSSVIYFEDVVHSHRAFAPNARSFPWISRACYQAFLCSNKQCSPQCRLYFSEINGKLGNQTVRARTCVRDASRNGSHLTFSQFFSSRIKCGSYFEASEPG